MAVTDHGSLTSGTKEVPAALSGGDLVRRHRLSTRIWHWASAGLMLILLMSGLMIFNAYPRLHWGSDGSGYDKAWLEIGAHMVADEPQGYVAFGGKMMNTTGVLGYSEDSFGGMRPRAFPKWATLPSYTDLAAARRWHLSAAWIFTAGTLVFALISFWNGHAWRALIPYRREMKASNIWGCAWDHCRFKMACGAEAATYNVLQKLIYLFVCAGLIPVVILTGMTMSPRIVASAPILLDMFGGRQSARSIHFIAATGLVAFVVIHILMVIAAGPFNMMRSMITGWYRLPKEREE
ncbi:MAG: cytochrome b/b6 domain-containing protein [Pseudomonadota bacterium]